MTIIGHLINGELYNDNNRLQDVFNPATGKSEKKVALASKVTVEKAIAAAQAAYPTRAVEFCTGFCKILPRLHSCCQDSAGHPEVGVLLHV